MSINAAALAARRLRVEMTGIADEAERANRAASGGLPFGIGAARGSSMGAGGTGGAGGNGGAGGGSTGPLASREAVQWLQRLWSAVERGNQQWEKAMPPGTVRRMHR